MVVDRAETGFSSEIACYFSVCDLTGDSWGMERDMLDGL